MELLNYFICLNDQEIFKIEDSVEGCIIQIKMNSIAILYDDGKYDNLRFKSITKDEFVQQLKENDIPLLLTYLRYA
jgi:hypothetical protein